MFDSTKKVIEVKKETSCEQDCCVRRKRPQLWTNQSWVLHHDNAPAHSSFIVRNFLAENEMTVFPSHPTLQIWL
jgi:hypothetical protein